MNSALWVLIQCLIWTVVGFALSLFNTFVLFVPWIELGWRGPVAQWLSDLGLGVLVGTWALVWSQMPEYALAILAGVAIGRLHRQTAWLIAVAYGIGLGLGDDIYVWLVDGLVYWGANGWPGGSLHLLRWHLITIMLAVIAALLTQRFRRRKSAKGFDVAPAA